MTQEQLNLMQSTISNHLCNLRTFNVDMLSIIVMTTESSTRPLCCTITNTQTDRELLLQLDLAREQYVADNRDQSM